MLILFSTLVTPIEIRSASNDDQIFFEINPRFDSELLKMMSLYGYSDIEIHKDFYNKNRFIIVSS